MYNNELFKMFDVLLVNKGSKFKELMLGKDNNMEITSNKIKIKKLIKEDLTIVVIPLFEVYIALLIQILKRNHLYYIYE